VKIKIERYLKDELQEADVIVWQRDLSKFRGPGVTSEVCYSLRKTGKARSDMPSGYSFVFEVVE
jgi:hypothetical protein